VLGALMTAAPASAASELVVTGHGWGHGVGMSQWGAYGYAQHGWSWQRILAHYYPGTSTGTAPLSRVRVLLATGQARVRVACPGAIKVSDASGRGYLLQAGRYSVGPRLRLPVGHRRVRVRGGAHHGEAFAKVVVPRALRSPLVFDCPSAPLSWNGRAYHGTLTVRHSGRRLSVVNGLPLEEYVQGVVAGEMPWRWNIAALEAQAVAARSYALATLKPGEHFDLFADTRSQVYGGITYETWKTNLAVQRTAGKVLMWNGRVATTYFFSTSGGRTADVRDVWPALGAVPYLRSVDDPYDARSPHHSWGPIALDARRIARRLRVPFGDVRVVRSPSGRVASVELGSHRIAGRAFSKALGLASTWFQVGELSLNDGRAQIVYGDKVQLAARAQGLGRALLQRRIGAGPWKTLKAVEGDQTVTVEPIANTVYRLSAGGVQGPEVTVAVAPQLDVTPAGAQVLAGGVEPRSHGSITVARQMAGAWKVVARPQLDRRGQFHTPLRLRPGLYRVSLDGDGRYASATKNVHVTSRLLASLGY
jgi:stage II sporulation protein D